MNQQFFFVLVGLVSLLSMVTAQFLCGNLPMVTDNKIHSCDMWQSSDKTKCNKVMLIVTGINSGASGSGVSVASGMKATAGIECHILTRKGVSTLFCREKKGGERFTLTLGSTKDVESVMIAISRRMVKVTVNKYTLAPASRKSSTLTKKAKIPYVIDAVFPIREDSGFCASSSGKIYYKANGSILRQARSGSGYRITAYKASF